MTRRSFLPRTAAARLGAGVLAAGLLLGGCASPPLPAEPVSRDDFGAVQRQLQTYIEHELAAHRLAGLSIALVDGQRTVWARGFGWADAAARVPAGPDTLYRVGSISKLFTGTAAMQLVAQGRLSLDAPVQHTLPWFRIGSAWPEAGPITLRHLLSHHAGLPRDMAAGMWLKAAPPPERDFRAMLRGLPEAQADAPPGQVFGYSNVGLNLVGAMVEAAAGEPFEQRVQRSVLEPLGLREARFSAELPALPAMARGHFKGEPQDEPALRDVPAGGLSASVAELARFVSAQFAGGVVLLPPAEQRAMLQRQFGQAALDADFAVGLGWMLTTFGTDTVRGGGPVAHHAGATFYFRSQLMMLPEHGLGVVVAANDGAGGDVVNRVAQRALALLLEARTGIRQRAARPGFEPAGQAWSAAQWRAVRDACAGDYMTLAGPVSMRDDGTRLRADLGGRELELREGADGRFGLGFRLLGLLPIPLGPLSTMGLECRRIEGRQVLLVVQDGERLLAGERLPEPRLPPAAEAWLGRYRPRLLPGELNSLGPPGEVRVLRADGRLWAEYRLHPAFGNALVRAPLHPIAPRAVRILGPLADSGPVARVVSEEGAAPQVHFSGWIFDRIGD